MQRLSVDDYYREALDILARGGSDALTIAAVCERLEVTKGSFYHHFGSMPRFVQMLLDFWAVEHSQRLIATSLAQPDPTLRILDLVELTVALPHASESAIRAWGRSNPAVAQAVLQVDQLREQHVADSIVAFGIDRRRARLLTRLALNLLIGTQTREQPADPKRMRPLFDEVVKLIFLEADPELVDRVMQAAGPRP